MYITEYLSNEIKPGKVNSSPSQLLEVVQENKLTHLPLFKGLDFVGNISEEDLIELSIDDEKVDMSFDLYFDSFWPKGLLPVGVIALFLITLLVLMYKDCRGKK